MDSSTSTRATPILGPTRSRLSSIEDERQAVHRIIAGALAQSEQWGLSVSDAGSRLGVSVEFFAEHIEPELRSVRRGRRRIIPVAELIYWLWRAAE